MLVSYGEVVKSFVSGQEVLQPVTRLALLADSPTAHNTREKDGESDSDSSSDKHVEETDDIAVLRKRDETVSFNVETHFQARSSYKDHIFKFSFRNFKLKIFIMMLDR